MHPEPLFTPRSPAAESYERIESWDDVRDAFDHLRKRYVDRFPWHREILQRYEDGRLTLHFHIATHEGGFCASACRDAGLKKNGGPAANAEGSGVTFRPNLEFPVKYTTGGQKQQSMFVLVYGNSEQPKDFIPSLVRLNVFDLPERTCRDGVRLRKTTQAVTTPIRIIGHWEVGCVPADNQLALRVSDRELPHDVIQGRAEVAEAVADNRAEPGRRLSRDSHIDLPYLLAFLSEDRVRMRVSVASDFGLEGVQMFLCPDDFEPGSVEGGHV